MVRLLRNTLPQTFNPRTGTFIGYDGTRHFCVAD